MVTLTWVGITPEQLARVADADKLIGEPLRRALQKSAIVVTSEAKRGTPVDTGRLRASVSNVVDVSPIPRFATVGTNVAYARYVHDGRMPGRMPPPNALATWARRHGGQNPFVLARTIARRGIKAKPFLRGPLMSNTDRIRGFFQAAGRDIEQAWAAGR